MTKLITVPTFTFNQGNPYTDEASELPLHVDFYQGCICIRQEGEYRQQEEIKVHPQFIKAFFKEVLKQLPEAESMLAMKNK